jgi:ribonuclease HI
VPPAVIISDREKARKEHDEIVGRNDPVIFTDGSGYENRVGAGVVIGDLRARSQMGTEEISTVYAAELRAIDLALSVTKESIESTGKLPNQQANQPGHQQDRQTATDRKLVIFTDSQAALKALRRLRMPSGQIYLVSAIEHLRWLTERGIHVEFRWIPAHEGVPGNELADATAKEAALTASTPGIKRRIRQHAKQAWEAAWWKERGARSTRRLIETAGKKEALQYWEGLRKATSSVLIQLRTGKIGLAGYLSKINARDSPRCDCDLGNQTVAHVLLECPLLQDERQTMRDDLATAGVSMQLGTDELLQQLPARSILAQFMLSTGLLDQFRHVDPTAIGVVEAAKDS